jgi:hypothetical protein
VAGSIYLRFGANGVGALSQNQWAPDLGNHDPNPPLQILDGPVFRLPIYTRIWQRSPWVAIGSQIAQPQISPPPPASPPQIAQYDWPVPRGYKYPITLRFWCNGVPLETGQIYGAPGEAPGYDFPTPPARRQPNLYGTWTQNLLQSTLAPAQAAAPFGQDDWPNPRPATRPAELLTSSGNLLESTLAAAAAMPLTPQVMPNPAPRPASVAPAAVQNLLESTLAADSAMPLTPQVMPNPPQRSAREAPAAGQNLLPTLLAAPQAVPFSQTDWPNPVQLRRAQQPEKLGGVVDAGDPRRGSVLDVPGRPAHPIELRTQARQPAARGRFPSRRALRCRRSTGRSPDERSTRSGCEPGRSTCCSRRSNPGRSAAAARLAAARARAAPGGASHLDAEPARVHARAGRAAAAG